MITASHNNLNIPCPHDGRVEYIQSGYKPNGELDTYINTGIIPKKGMKYEIVAQYVEDVEGKWMTICGVYGAGPAFRLTYRRNYGSPTFSGTWLLEGFTGKPNIFTDISKYRGEVKYDTEIALTLFGQNEKQGENVQCVAHTQQTRIYEYKCYSSDGLLIQDFIPVRYKDDGAFFDKVSGKLFLNKGVDKFIVGPDAVR